MQSYWHEDGPEGEYRELEAADDLAWCLSRSTFSQVAVMGDGPVGVVLARADEVDGAWRERWEAVAAQAAERMRVLAPEAYAARLRFIEVEARVNEVLLREERQQIDAVTDQKSGQADSATGQKSNQSSSAALVAGCRQTGLAADQKSNRSSGAALVAGQAARDCQPTGVNQLAAELASSCQLSDQPPSAEITLLAVSPRAAGKGVGSTLLDTARTHLIQQGATTAYLYTDTSCNWRFYERQGLIRAAIYRPAPEERGILEREMYLYRWNLGHPEFPAADTGA